MTATSGIEIRKPTTPNSVAPASAPRMVAAGLIVIPEQTTLGVSGAATWWGGALVTRARLANALDSERFDVVGYPLPGRSFYVSAEVRSP